MEKKRVLIVTQEMEPYLIQSEVSKVIGSYPQYIQEHGLEIRVLMPRFGSINERRHRLHEVVRLSGINIQVDDDDYPLLIKVASLPGARMQVYFLDNEDFFKRKSVFGDETEPFFADNTERMIFFCKGVIETVRKFGWPPHIIHCHGWMTSLIPYYLKNNYKNDPVFQNTKVVYSVYENSFEGALPNEFAKKAASGVNFELFEKGDNTSLSVGGASFADAIIKASAVVPALVQAVLNQNGKPVLDYQEEDAVPVAYEAFYKELLND
jgi:starch synthase